MPWTVRLDKFESQKELADLIKQSSDGMDGIRKQLIMISLMEPGARDSVRHLLMLANPFIVAFKKHTKTATSLLLGCFQWVVCTWIEMC